MTFPPSNQLNHQQGEQEAQPERVYYSRQSNPLIFWSTEVPRLSTIEAVQPINYNSAKRNEARARDILKSEFTEPAPNSKRQSHSDQTHSSLHPQHSQEKATEPETYTATKRNTSEQVITMTSGISKNLKVKNAKQTAATQSRPISENQARITSKAQRYPIDDEPVPSAPDQKTIQQVISSANEVTKVRSNSNRNKQGSAKPKKTKSTQRSFPSVTK